MILSPRVIHSIPLNEHPSMTSEDGQDRKRNLQRDVWGPKREFRTSFVLPWKSVDAQTSWDPDRSNIRMVDIVRSVVYNAVVLWKECLCQESEIEALNPGLGEVVYIFTQDHHRLEHKLYIDTVNRCKLITVYTISAFSLEWLR